MEDQEKAVILTEPHNFTHDGDCVLVLKRLDKDGCSYGGCKLPESGQWTAPEVWDPAWGDKPSDWKGGFDPNPVCGGGIHGWPWGMGLGEGSDYSFIHDIWCVIAVRPEDVVGNIQDGRKCKFKTGLLVFRGAFVDAWMKVCSGRHALIGQMAKERGNIAGGYMSNAASSGYRSNAASSGDMSNAASSGYRSNAASSGYRSNAASSGYGSNAASSGDMSNAASSGYRSNAAASGKDCAVACAGMGGTVTVGPNGAFAIAYWADDGPRFLTGKVGENDILADTTYCVQNGKLAKVK
jgi:hypothetical protein